MAVRPIPKVPSSASAAAAAAAGPAEEPARELYIPPELLDSIFAKTGGPHVAAVSRGMRLSTEWNRNIEWTKLYRQLRNNPLIASYIASLGLGDLQVPGREKFQRLFEAMTAELGIPASIRGVDRFSLQCYVQFSNAVNRSLDRAWGRMRDALIGVGAGGAAFPGPNARTAEIRAWLNNPANSAVLGAVRRLDLSQCDLLVIPNEIRKFPNLVSLDLSKNEIKEIGSRQFDGLVMLQAIYLNNNRLERLPAELFRGHANLRALYLNNNRLKRFPPGLLRGFNSLQKIFLNDNKLESLPFDLFQGHANLQEIVLAGNLLTNLPAHLFRGRVNLLQIDLNDNRLESLPPDLFRDLDSLQWLFLAGNRLENLPEGLFQDLTQLAQLSLHDNLSDLSNFSNKLTMRRVRRRLA